MDSEPADRVVVPEPPVLVEPHQHLAAVVALLAVHTGYREGARSRGRGESERVMRRELEPPREGFGDEDRAARELSPRARRARLRESHARVTLGREPDRVHIQRAVRRGNHDPAALAVSAPGGHGEEGAHALGVEPSPGVLPRSWSADVDVRAQRLNEPLTERFPEALHHDRDTDHAGTSPA